jgi:Glycosyl transferases group 1
MLQSLRTLPRELDATRWRRALFPDAWQNLALETYASVRSLPLPQVTADPPWTLDPVSLDGLAIRWPRVTKPPDVGRMLAPVRRAMSHRVRLELADIPQPEGSVVVMELVGDGGPYPVAIDLWDRSSFFDADLVKGCLVYFKMQYLGGGYGIPQVVPGGYVTEKGTIYSYLPYLRRLRDHQDFSCDVYGRFGLRFGADLRRRTVSALSAQQRFAFSGGHKTVPVVSFEREIARSRVCIDLPGQDDAFCSRLISYMAVGACIVGPRPKNELQVPLVDRVHVAWTHDDQSDLVDLCEYYVKNQDAREKMASEARQFFDRYLHAESLAAYYLHMCVSRLPEV